MIPKPKSMFTSLLNLFFPDTCAGCTSFLLEYESVLCTECRHKLPLTLHHLNPENEAYKKFYGKVDVEFVVTFIYYNKKGIVQEMIHKLKYKGHQEIGETIGHMFSKDIKSLQEVNPIDQIIPVPLHKRKLRERGYNQVTAFANSLANDLCVQCNENLLFRVLYSKTQTKKGLFGRSEIGTDIFSVVFGEDDHHKHYLIVDDVLTTGSTLEACCRAINKIPGAKISIACMAMSQS